MAAALRLAGTIPGTDAYRERLDRAAAVFASRSAKGKSTAATLTVLKGQRPHDIYLAFDGLHLADLAARLGFSAEDFVEALPAGEDTLFLALIATAAGNADTALAASLIAKLVWRLAIADQR
ncbi:MAG: hypothetical protein HC850_01345, partial [Rhodomicrobium sp.]|nr:hypothetical protein [Rhodomicrobium sp.]